MAYTEVKLSRPGLKDPGLNRLIEDMQKQIEKMSRDIKNLNDRVAVLENP